MNLDLSAENILGWTTLAFALAIVILGMPGQLIKHYREKWCGINLLWLLLSIGVQGSRIAYLAVKGAYYPIIPDSLGIALLLIFLGQWLFYNWGHEPPIKVEEQLRRDVADLRRQLFLAQEKTEPAQ